MRFGFNLIPTWVELRPTTMLLAFHLDVNLLFSKQIHFPSGSKCLFCLSLSSRWAIGIVRISTLQTMVIPLNSIVSLSLLICTQPLHLLPCVSGRAGVSVARGCEVIEDATLSSCREVQSFGFAEFMKWVLPWGFKIFSNQKKTWSFS